jgi:hypothetical protein
MTTFKTIAGGVRRGKKRQAFDRACTAGLRMLGSHIGAGQTGRVATFSFLGLVVLVLLSGCRSTTTVSKPAMAINQRVVSLISHLLVDDINSETRGQDSVIGRQKRMLAIFQLDRLATAKGYEAAYDSNEIAADNEFKGKRILLSGIINSIDKDFKDDGYITLQSSGLIGVHAQLSASGMVGAASFNKGQQIGLVCTGTGRVLTIATLDNCEPLVDYLDGLSPSIDSEITEFLQGKRELPQDVALEITTFYVYGLSLPADSPCLNGVRENCVTELKASITDKEKLQMLRNRAAQMMTSLRVD